MQKKESNLYDVESLDNLLGNEFAIGKMRSFASGIGKNMKNAPLLLYGPSGTGKSVAASLLAKENNWNIVELNASDYRDKESIEKTILSAATSKPLFKSRNLILLDEIDELAAGFDRGAAPVINTIINESKNPIIFIANDMWDQSISFLRGKTEPVAFKKLNTEVMQKVLTNLCSRFSLKVNRNALEMIAHRANGDARSAINDLSVIIGAEDNEEITEVIGLRDRKIDVFNLLDKIFLTNTFSAPLRSITSSDLTNDMLIKWIDENIPRRYRQNEEMYYAFESLAYATIFGSRATRSQYYTYWRYMNVLMSSGIALSKKEYPNTSNPYGFPKVIKELSSSKTSRNQNKIIAAKLQRVFHSSISKIIKNEMRLLSQSVARAVKDNKEVKQEVFDYLASTFQLDDKEIEYMLNNQ
ncbi:MAG: replication factor C large subunit [Candidatus Micrarchaeaceae archaeon]|jgi:replication factor C large subunit